MQERVRSRPYPSSLVQPIEFCFVGRIVSGIIPWEQGESSRAWGEGRETPRRVSLALREYLPSRKLLHPLHKEIEEAVVVERDNGLDIWLWPEHRPPSRGPVLWIKAGDIVIVRLALVFADIADDRLTGGELAGVLDRHVHRL